MLSRSLLVSEKISGTIFAATFHTARMAAWKMWLGPTSGKREETSFDFETRWAGAGALSEGVCLLFRFQQARLLRTELKFKLLVEYKSAWRFGQ